MAREDYSIEEALFAAHIGEPNDVLIDDSLIANHDWKMMVWFIWEDAQFEIGVSEDRWLWWHKGAKVDWYKSSLPRILKLLNDPAFRKKHGLGHG